MTNWLDDIDTQLTAIADHYEKSAPTVNEWANDVCIRISEKPETVVLPELLFVGRLQENGEWLAANYAANQLYHLLHRLGRDVSGHAGY